MRAAAWLRRLGRAADRALLHLFYPENAVCLVCGRTAGGQLLCEACAALMANDRLRQEDPEIRAVWRYNGPAGALVRLIKERGVAAAADVLARDMAEELRKMAPGEDAVVTWVPMPDARRRERGIDHGRVLAEALAKQAGLPVRPLLRRTVRNAKTQRGLSQRQRLENVRGGFAATADVPAVCVLVDDVVTTGATLAECRETLLAAGAERVIRLAACTPDADREP